jgi:pilus assembly protein CpaB
MDAKKVVLLIVALIIAGGTAFMARSMFKTAATPAAQAIVAQKTGPQILVATRALPVGTIITADSFRFQPWPEELVENAYYIKGDADTASLAGTVVRTAITAGQPVTQGAIVKPGDRGFLAAALGPGMRAVTVAVSAASGVSGFVFPGDRVDVLLTQKATLKNSAGEGDIGEVNSAETIIRNVRVLATDQRTVSEGEDGKQEVKVFANVTLEVTPRISEKLSAAASMGQISLSLRSIADTTTDLEQAIATGQVKMPENGDPAAERRAIMSVASRPNDTNTTYVSSPDVSNFAKRILQMNMASLARKAAIEHRATAAAAGPAGGGSVFNMDNRSTGPVVRVIRGSNKSPEVVSVGSN